MNRLLVISSALVVLISSTVYAEENKETSEKSDWFGELRVSHEFSDSISTSDSTAGNDRMQTFKGVEVSSLTSFGAAMGKRFDNDFYVSLGLEKFSSPEVKATGGYTTVGGDVTTSATFPFEMTNYMLEVGLTNQMSENFDLRLFGGLGLASAKSKDWSAVTSGVSGFASSRATTKSNTSMRVGFGLGYKLSEGTELVTTVQYSNYGEVFWKNSDNNNGITSKIKSVEAGLRLVFDL
jgi:opacity protein-like surface antigen